MVRITAWKDPFGHIESSGYQLSESLFAIGSGGFAGRGLGRGMPYYIPVAESDFVFSAICEELGVIFGLALLLIYLSSFIAIQNIAMKCKDPFYKYVTFGIAIIYIFQVFLNIGGVTKFIPSTGVTLPLISYGISSVFSTLIMFSIIQYAYILVGDEADELEKEKERIESRIADRSGAEGVPG
jgi:peptidoglycan glycosyltransferase